MQRSLDTTRYILLAAASGGNLLYHLKLLKESGLITDEGITEKGLDILKPIMTEELFNLCKVAMNHAGLEENLLLNPEISEEVYKTIMAAQST